MRRILAPARRTNADEVVVFVFSATFGDQERGEASEGAKQADTQGDRRDAEGVRDPMPLTNLAVESARDRR